MALLPGWKKTLKTYDRFDSLQENLKACRKETESLEKGWGRRPWRKGSGRNEMTAMRRYWKAFARQEKNTRQPLTAGERLGEYSGRIGLLAEGWRSTGRREEEAGGSQRSVTGQQARRAAGQTMPTEIYQRFLDNSGGNPGFTAHRKASPCPVCGSVAHPAPARYLRRETRQPGQGRPAKARCRGKRIRRLPG